MIQSWIIKSKTSVKHKILYRIESLTLVKGKTVIQFCVKLKSYSSLLFVSNWKVKVIHKNFNLVRFQFFNLVRSQFFSSQLCSAIHNDSYSFIIRFNLFACVTPLILAKKIERFIYYSSNNITPLILAKKIELFIYYSSNNIFNANHMRHTSSNVHLLCDTCIWRRLSQLDNRA